MKGINKVILVATCGNDPQVKNFPNGGKLVQFSVATNESWVDKNTGERKQASEWHRVVANNRTADIIEQYVKKGMRLYIEGSLKTRKWTDQQGIERYATEINCFTVQILEQMNQQGQGQQNQQRQNNQSGYGGNTGFQPNQQNNNQPDPSLSDDLPFFI